MLQWKLDEGYADWYLVSECSSPIHQRKNGPDNSFLYSYLRTIAQVILKPLKYTASNAKGRSKMKTRKT